MATSPLWREGGGREPVVALVFDSFALWCAARDDPTLAARPLALLRRGRVAELTRTARRAGVRPGMSAAAARLAAVPGDARPAPIGNAADRARGAAPALALPAFVEDDPPAALAAWEGLLEELLAFTPWLESVPPPGAPLPLGRALLRAAERDAHELAAACGGPGGAAVGVAPSRSGALAAALTGRPGGVRALVDAAAEQAFLARLPLRFLRGFGVPRERTERLAWLGLERVGELAAWSATQRRALLGADAARLAPLFAGTGEARSDRVARFVAPPRLSARFEFDEPALEPWQLDPALRHLAETLVAALGERGAARLRVRAEAAGVAFRATRIAKRPLREVGEIARAARRALTDAGADGLGFDGVTLELSAILRSAEQGELFAASSRRRAEAEAAVRARFPAALAELHVGDPYALAAERRAAYRPPGAVEIAPPDPPRPLPLPPLALPSAPPRAARRPPRIPLPALPDPFPPARPRPSSGDGAARREAPSVRPRLDPGSG